jgi:NADPH:quinone reductase-like Zn-dependent oxidoreductase
MKALCYTRPLGVGEFEAALEMCELSVPEPAEGQLLVRMHASSINIDDIHVAEGTFLGGMSSSQASPKQPSTPGVDVAGIVEKVGLGVIGFAEGDSVLGILGPKPGPGAWAEYCCLPAVMARKIPGGYRFEEAAACAVAGKTAANAVISAKLQSGQTALVVGASGGIGSIIVQILHHQGVRVLGVCSARNAALVGSLGAETIVDYIRGPFGEQLGKVRVDVVIDCVGGRDVEQQGLLVLKKQGRFVTLVGPHRFIGETRLGRLGIVRMLAYMFRRSLLSRLSGPRYCMAGFGRSLEPLQRLVLHNGIKPAIGREVPFELDAVREAVVHVRSHRASGKVVINIAGSPEL